ncbi:hypothetical protein PR003_g2080 [Phytophthora rubi]|uniref:Uncharacterized protein n=1 Tax=Phytophthora rubi TaxID=129364 RepID=A0A6A3NMH3_9STRA|nr:hypothetical protein PR002_g4055 [Phytophthora rubi]KAE9047988.1 hypothetical protein PR001_g4001 [Phytophthora rubi]KAE9356875.1 hypothetical protein PR003_g2080 [Phytophthora rubi]
MVVSGGQGGVLSASLLVSSLGGAGVATTVTTESSVGASLVSAAPTLNSAGLISGTSSTLTGGFTFLGTTGGSSLGWTGDGQYSGTQVAASVIAVPTAPMFVTSVWSTVPAPSSLGSTSFLSHLAGSGASAVPVMARSNLVAGGME